MFICVLSVFVSIQVSDAYVKVLSVIVYFSFILVFWLFFVYFSFILVFLVIFISKIFYHINVVLLAFFILSCKSVWWWLSLMGRF